MRVAVVTGGSRGIGRAIKESFIADGIEVVSISQSIGKYKADLSKRACRIGLIDRIVREYGRIDILVNNAGSQHYDDFLDYRLEDWDDSISLMLTAPFELSQQAGYWMKKQGGGKIINIGSIVGIQGTRQVIGYCCAKAGVIHLTKCMSNELAPHNIQVNCVVPGYIETDMLQGAFRDEEHKRQTAKRIPAGRIGEPKDVANAVSFLVSDKADYITGSCLMVEGGWCGR